MGKSKSPSRSRPGRNGKIYKMDFGITRVDLALEKSNPLTTHIVLYWKYSVEKKKIINGVLFCASNEESDDSEQKHRLLMVFALHRLSE